MGADLDNVRDALAWTRATIVGDKAGRDAIARNCDPVGMVDAITALYVGVLVRVTIDPVAHIDLVLARATDVFPDDDGTEAH